MFIWLHCNAFYFLTATPPVIDYRLPALLKPNHYTLKLRPDIYTGDPSTFTFNGSVDIDVTCTQDTDKVILHSRSLNIQSFKVLEDAVSGSELALGEHKYDSITEFLTVPLSGATLKKGNHYIIKVTFDGKILPDLRGIYYSSYEYGDETRYNAFSLFRCHWNLEFLWCKLCRHWWHRGLSYHNLRCHKWRRTWHHDNSQYSVPDEVCWSENMLYARAIFIRFSVQWKLKVDILTTHYFSVSICTFGQL